MRLTFGLEAGSMAGKVIVSFFLLFFLAVGIFLGSMMLEAVRELAASYAWKEAACRILSSSGELDPSAGPSSDRYLFRVTFEYQFEGRRHVSDRLSPQDAQRFGRYEEVSELERRYGVGTTTVCFVDPGSPGSAVLRRQNPAVALVGLFPIVFIVIGAGGLFGLWRPRPPKPVSESGVAAPARWVFIPFCGVFLLFGLLGTYFMLVRPIAGIAAATGWKETPCRILSSRVHTSSGGDGSTYRVDILYEYEVDGRTYRSSRYDFLGGSSSGRAAKARAVERFSAGSRHMCHVNPHDPSEAVLARGFSPDMWFGLIPLVFLLIGAAGLLTGVLPSRTGPPAPSSALD